MAHRPNFLAGLLAVLLALSGLFLLVGGAWLVGVGGSWYYLVAGAALLVDAWLLWRGRAAAVWLFALVLAATLAWALWESGVDWWPLAARIDVLFVLGLVMLLPAATKRVETSSALARGVLSVVLLACLLVAAVSWVRDPHDTEGSLSAAAAAPATATAAADWTAYGGTGLGQRYSALAQITPQNVDKLQQVWQYHTGDERGQPGDPVETTYEVTPLKIGQRLFFCTPHQHVVALDATTGKEVWHLDPKIRGDLALQHLTCRGLSYQPPAAAAPAAASTPAALTTTASVTPEGTSTASVTPSTVTELSASAIIGAVKTNVASAAESSGRLLKRIFFKAISS